MNDLTQTQQSINVKLFNAARELQDLQEKYSRRQATWEQVVAAKAKYDSLREPMMSLALDECYRGQS